MTLLAVPLVLLLPSFSLTVCLPTFFAAVLNFFLPLTTSAISGAANSNKSASRRFEAETTQLRKNRIAVLPITCTSARIPDHVVDQYLYRIESPLFLKQASCNFFRVKRNVGDFFKHQNKTSDTNIYKRYFLTTRVSQVNVNTMKKKLSNCRLLKV